MRIGNLRISSRKVKDLPDRFKRFVQDQVFPIKVNIDIECPEDLKPKGKEMCVIVDKDERNTGRE